MLSSVKNSPMASVTDLKEAQGQGETKKKRKGKKKAEPIMDHPPGKEEVYDLMTRYFMERFSAYLLAKKSEVSPASILIPNSNTEMSWPQLYPKLPPLKASQTCPSHR